MALWRCFLRLGYPNFLLEYGDGSISAYWSKGLSKLLFETCPASAVCLYLPVPYRVAPHPLVDGSRRGRDGECDGRTEELFCLVCRGRPFRSIYVSSTHVPFHLVCHFIMCRFINVSFQERPSRASHLPVRLGPRRETAGVHQHAAAPKGGAAQVGKRRRCNGRPPCPVRVISSQGS